MAGRDDDIEMCIAALQAVRLYGDEEADSPEQSARIYEICAALAAKDRSNGSSTGLRTNVADAISRTYLKRPFE